MRPYLFLARLKVSMAAVCVSAGTLLVQAQSPPSHPSKPSRDNPNATKPDSSSELKRATAILLLNTLAEEARSYSDLGLRARVQARVADSLWETERESARELFLRAWESGENAEKEVADKTKGQPGTGATRPLKLRDEILRMVARRDKELGEALLAKLTNEREHDGVSAARNSGDLANHIDPTKPLPVGLAQRLALSTQLLREGEVERALEFAGPAVAYPTIQGVAFLSMLREKRAAAGDAQFVALVSRAAADPLSDANSVSILSSYIFTPFLFVTANHQGGTGISQLRGPAPPPPVSPELRLSFMRQVLNILLRPLPTAGPDQTTAGPTGTYIIISRLLPLYDQYASNLAPLLRTQLAALSPTRPDDSRPGLREALTKGLNSEANSTDESQNALEQIERLSSSDAKDHAYANVAFRAANRGDSSYTRLVDKIADGSLRQRVRALADFAFARYALNKKDAETAVRIAKTGNLSRIQSVWVLTEAANLLAKLDLTLALQLLDLASAEVDRIDVSSVDRVRGLGAVANSFVKIDKPRAWTLLSDAVNASNKIENFSEAGGTVGAVIETGSGILAVDVNAPSFSLAGLFQDFVNDDPYRAIDLAKNIKSTPARAAAIITIASTILREKPKTVTAGPGTN